MEARELVAVEPGYASQIPLMGQLPSDVHAGLDRFLAAAVEEDRRLAEKALLRVESELRDASACATKNIAEAEAQASTLQEALAAREDSIRSRGGLSPTPSGARGPGPRDLCQAVGGPGIPCQGT